MIKLEKVLYTGKSVPGVERSVVQSLVDTAHKTCPYSKAIRGSIDVLINVI